MKHLVQLKLKQLLTIPKPLINLIHFNTAEQFVNELNQSIFRQIGFVENQVMLNFGVKQCKA